jgi:hypothetical protein
MTNKRIALVAVAALALTAPIGLAASRGGAIAAPAPHPAHTAPMRTTSTSTQRGINGPNWHHHRGRVVIFYDAFGYPFWGWDYPYGYYPYTAYYNGTAAYDAGGSVVVQVQERLARTGYYHGAVDGEIGPRTHAAIRRYERSHGLHVDGEISEELLVTMGLRG